MKVDLSEQDIINTIGFLNVSPIRGEQALAMAVLLQTYRAFLQPTPEPDGSKPAEEIPAEKPTT